MPEVYSMIALLLAFVLMGVPAVMVRILGRQCFNYRGWDREVRQYGYADWRQCGKCRKVDKERRGVWH